MWIWVLGIGFGGFGGRGGGAAAEMHAIKRFGWGELSQMEIYRYMVRKEPIILTDLLPEAKIESTNIEFFLDICGKEKAHEGITNHILSAVLSLSDEEREQLGQRIEMMFGVKLDRYMEMLRGDYTVESIHRHMKNFDNTHNKFEYLADYALPLTLHDWPIAQCTPFMKHITARPLPLLDMFQRHWDQYVKEDGEDDNLYEAGVVFHATKGTRAYPLHRHEFDNQSIMMVFQGSKRFAIFNRSEEIYLYPTQKKIETEFELTDRGDHVFEAEIFFRDYDKHPLLEKASGFEGVVGKGEIIVIPCESIHLIHNEEENLAVAWHGPCITDEFVDTISAESNTCDM